MTVAASRPDAHTDCTCDSPGVLEREKHQLRCVYRTALDARTDGYLAELLHACLGAWDDPDTGMVGFGILEEVAYHEPVDIRLAAALRRLLHDPEGETS